MTPTKSRPVFHDTKIAAVFDAYPAPLRAPLLALRDLIVDTAATTDGVGTLVETLKWGQPAYLTERPRTGSTIRIDALKNADDGYAMFFHCQSRLVPTFRELYPDAFTFEGNRALHFTTGEAPPHDALRHCIALALTYHSKRRTI